jgi:hypothetical protein
MAPMQTTPDFDRGPVESGDFAVADHARFPTRGGSNVAVTAVLIAALGLLLLLSVAVPAKAVDLDEVTVVTMARDGSWGVATAGSTGEAIATAVRACRAMADAPTDCGALLTTTHGKWVLANLCGDHQIIVGAGTLEDAEATAREREIDTRRSHLPDLPPCRRILTVDPAGVVIASQKRPRRIDARHGER